LLPFLQPLGQGGFAAEGAHEMLASLALIVLKVVLRRRPPQQSAFVRRDAPLFDWVRKLHSPIRKFYVRSFEHIAIWTRGQATLHCVEVVHRLVPKQFCGEVVAQSRISLELAPLEVVFTDTQPTTQATSKLQARCFAWRCRSSLGLHVRNDFWRLSNDL
jgi:hypothetical protein